MGVLDNGRTWNCTIDIYDLEFKNPANDNSIQALLTATYTNQNIKNWKITDTMSANGDVAFGSTGSKALNLELAGLSSKSFGTGAIIGVTLGGAASAAWYFFVDTVAWNTEYGTTTKYAASVTAYDAMYYASGKISGLLQYSSLPPSIKSKIQSGTASVTDCKTIAQYCIRHARYDLIRTRAHEIATEQSDPAEYARYETFANMYDSTADDGYSSGKTMDNVCADSTGKVTIGTYSGYTGNLTISGTLTGRTLLGRMAAMAGLRAYCDNSAITRVGNIDFANLVTTTYTTITTADVYDNGFVSEGKKKFTYFTTGKEDYGKKTSNSFSTMSINCPDMTASKLSSVASGFMNTEYEIGQVKFRGDPNLTSGMRLNAPDGTGTTHNMICTKVVTNYDGGLYQTVYSEGKSDSDIEFENNAYAENAEQIVDEGGGGGSVNLLYYTETQSPDSATIAVSGNSIVTDTSGISITGNTGITGDLSVTGDITCGGTMTYDILSANGLIVSGGASIGGNISTGDGSVIAMSKSTSLGTYYGSITATKLEGHDILLSTPRFKAVGAHTYQSFNTIAVCTYDPTLAYPTIPPQSEDYYGSTPVVYLRQGREKDGSIDAGTIGSVLGASSLRFYDREKTITNEYGTYTIPAGGFSIGYDYNGTNYSSAVIKFMFFDYQNNIKGTYNITMANIAALANLT